MTKDTDKVGGWLVLTRRVGESLRIGDATVVVRALDKRRDQVQLAILAPLSVSILRSELLAEGEEDGE